MSDFKFRAHFSDGVNFGAIRDEVLSCHLASDLPDSLYKSVMDQFPFDIPVDEKARHLKSLIEYASYVKSNGKPDFFFWLTES